MPTFTITDPDSGLSLNITGDSPPTEQELEEIFATMAQQQQPEQRGRAQALFGDDIAPPPQPPGGLEAAGLPPQQLAPPVGPVAGIEPALAIGTGIVAEPIAGLAGLAATPFGGAQLGTEAIEATREALTFQPKTEPGRAGLQAVGETLAPVGEVLSKVEKTLGDATFNATGSPALAAAAATAPTAFGELLGIGLGKGAVKVGQKTAKEAKDAVKRGVIDQEIADAVPTIDQLKDTSRAVYKEIDDLGAVVTDKSYRKITRDLNKVFRTLGGDKNITPKATASLERFNQAAREKRDIPLSEIDILRTVAGNAAKSLEAPESAIGTAMIDVVDSSLDKFKKKDFTGAIEGAEITSRYKVARNLWGRARRSELIQEAFTKARNQASGFENGIRTQFRSILNSKRQRRLFNEQELDAMRNVVQGTKKENLAKFIGRLGFFEGGSTSLLGAATGSALGAAVAGPVGAAIVPMVGQVSKSLAQRMTRRGAEFVDEVIRAGRDARQITEAYIRHTPKKARRAEELSELLMRPDIDLTDIPDNDIARRAVQLAQQRRAAVTGAVVGSLPQQTQQQGQAIPPEGFPPPPGQLAIPQGGF